MKSVLIYGAEIWKLTGYEEKNNGHKDGFSEKSGEGIEEGSNKK